MNAIQDLVCPCTANWAEAEARFQRAKHALLDIQQQHLAAADEFLLARAQMGQILEATFPGADELPRSSVSKLSLETCGDCNRAAA